MGRAPAHWPVRGSNIFDFNIFIEILFSETREQNYEKFLMPAFKDEVRSRAKNPEHCREKFSSNSLFERPGYRFRHATC